MPVRWRSENSRIGELKILLGDWDPEHTAFLECQSVPDELEAGRVLLRLLIDHAAKDVRCSIPASEPVIGLKCGGSDGLSDITANPLVGHIADRPVSMGGSALLAEVPEMFGAEGVLFRRCADETVQRELPALVADFKDYFVRHGQVVYENPSPGNKAGGITTLEEKSLGCVQRGGSPPHLRGAALRSAGREPRSDRASDPRQRSGVHHRSGGVRGGDRIGIYYPEKGASQRGSVCIYDRAHSAIQEAQPSDFDWDAIFDGADWFHFTGITPALGSNLVEICKDACVAAKKHGVKISCDLNYRGKLWTREQARAAMTELCQYVDVCISNEEDAKDVFGIEAENTDIYGGKLNKEGYKSVAKQLADRFGFEKVAITLRTSLSASDNDWAGMLYDGENYCFSKEYHLHIVDRVGGGDSFGGGLIYALLNGKDSQSAIEFAVAASALKHSIEGDFNRVTVSEVEKLAGGDGSGRVQR